MYERKSEITYGFNVTIEHLWHICDQGVQIKRKN